jgi:P2 family phage contractile tail tube protein
MNVNSLIGANVYVDGTSYFGQVEEIGLPELNPIMLEHKAAGMIGKIELPSGFDKMEGKLKINSVYPDMLKKVADITKAHQLIIRASLETWVGGSKTGEVPVVAYIRGIWKKFPGIGIKQQDNPEAETMMAVHAYRFEVDGQEIINVDFMASIYSVGGDDKLAQYRANLGI